MKRLAAFFGSLLVATATMLPASAVFAAGDNLIANPGFETASGNAPASWLKDNWGKNTAVFTYETTGHTGSRSASVTVSKYSTGDAKWYFAPVTVTPGAKYTFTDWYKSTAVSGIDMVVTTTAGKTNYVHAADPAKSADWKQVTYGFTAPANAKEVTFYHYMDRNGTLTVDDYSLTADDGTVTPPPANNPPTVSLTAPANNATVGNSVSVTANAADDKAVTSVQFKLDGNNLGAADTAAPYSVNWDTTTVANGTHALTAVATDSDNATTTSAAVTVNVQNTAPATPPTVSVTAPAANATVSGTAQAVTATASGNPAVTSVQFKLDGNNLGAADTSAPYSINWDTTTVTNGNHTLTAVATNSASQSTTSAGVTVNVQNQVVTPPAGGNLIANPSVETANNNLPVSWLSDSWGTNTHSFTYENTGQDGTHSVKTAVSKYTSGDAKWYFNPVNVTAGKNYEYTEWYKSNIVSEVDAMVTANDGTVSYYYLGAPAAAADWTKLSYQFTAPANAKTVTIFHVVAKVGYVQSDNFSFGEYAPAQFNRALVSLTFDDGWRNIYTNGFPLLQKYGLVSTQYLNSTPVIQQYPDYMTYQMIKDWKANGHELAWHTQDHVDLTTQTAAQLNTQLTIPAAFLTGTGTTAADWKNFATPYGAYNPTVIQTIMAKYRSHRSTDVGYNSKDNFDISNIKVQNIEATTTPADVAGWVAQAQATKTWLVIVYHEVSTTPEDNQYYVTPANLDSELNSIKQSGVTVKTVDQALDEVTSQL